MIIETQEMMLLLTTVSLLRSPGKCGWMLEIATLHWVFENHIYTHTLIDTGTHTCMYTRIPASTNRHTARQADEHIRVAQKRKKKNNTYHKLIRRESTEQKTEIKRWKDQAKMDSI